MNRSPIKLKINQLYTENQLSSQIDPEIRHIFEQSKFTRAMKLLEESYFPPQISCRDEQIKYIEDYLIQNIALGGCSESLYISGQPGIGKTLCVKEVTRRVCEQNPQDAMHIYTNALTLRKQQDIYKVIYYEMTKKMIDPNMALIYLNEYFQKGKELPHSYYPKLKRKKILIIDQIDYLNTRDEDVLYSIFQWTQKKKSNLIIIAISNTLDFPEVLLPKITSRIGYKKLNFKHYSSDQILKIITQRIQKQEIFDEQALTYISKKIAGSSSDIRKCLFILREAINCHLIAEFDRGKVQGKVHYKQKRQKCEDKISIDLLVRVHQQVYKGNFSISFKDFPPAYKIVLYCLAKYYRCESKTCTIRQLQSLLGVFVKSQSQLRPILTDLKQLGLISIKFLCLQKQSKTFLHFDNLTFLKEENINLLIQYDKIFVALQKEDLSQIDFNINLNC